MKVIIISKDPNKQGREKNILKILSSFDRDKDIEFYAYGTKNNEMEIDSITFIPAWEKYTVNSAIAFSRYIGDSERTVIVFEDGIIPKSIGKILDHHINGQYGITLSLYKKENEYYSCGVYIVEREYLDMLSGGLSFESEICVLCAENGDLGIFYE